MKYLIYLFNNQFVICLKLHNFAGRIKEKPPEVASSGGSIIYFFANCFDLLTGSSLVTTLRDRPQNHLIMSNYVINDLIEKYNKIF